MTAYMTDPHSTISKSRAIYSQRPKFANLLNYELKKLLSGLNILAIVRDDIEISPDDEHRQKTAILDQIESQREAKAICKSTYHVISAEQTQTGRLFRLG